MLHTATAALQVPTPADKSSRLPSLLATFLHMVAPERHIGGRTHFSSAHNSWRHVVAKILALSPKDRVLMEAQTAMQHLWLMWQRMGI